MNCCCSSGDMPFERSIICAGSKFRGLPPPPPSRRATARLLLSLSSGLVLSRVSRPSASLADRLP